MTADVMARSMFTGRRGTLPGSIASHGFKKPLSHKWMIKSLAAMTAQFLEGGIPAAALPLKASAFSER